MLVRVTRSCAGMQYPLGRARVRRGQDARERTGRNVPKLLLTTLASPVAPVTCLTLKGELVSAPRVTRNRRQYINGKGLVAAHALAFRVQEFECRPVCCACGYRAFKSVNVYCDVAPPTDMVNSRRQKETRARPSGVELLPFKNTELRGDLIHAQQTINCFLISLSTRTTARAY